VKKVDSLLYIYIHEKIQNPSHKSVGSRLIKGDHGCEDLQRNTHTIDL
jgi:hypothetical protein